MPRPAAIVRLRSSDAASSVAIDISFGRHLRACSKAASTFLPAASDVTLNRSGYASTIFNVLVPIEPVDPKMAIRLAESEEFSSGKAGLEGLLTS